MNALERTIVSAFDQLCQRFSDLVQETEVREALAEAVELTLEDFEIEAEADYDERGLRVRR